MGFHMQENNNTKKIYSSIPVNDGVLVLSGYSVTLKVQNGCLQVIDGVGDEARKDIFSKPNCRIKRVVILGYNGSVSLSSLKWLFDIGAGILQIGWNGEIYYSAIPHKSDIFLKRAQYKAVENEKGLELTKYLLGEKIKNQLHNIINYFPDNGYVYNEKLYNQDDFIKGVLSDIKYTNSIDGIIGIESVVSAMYWILLSDLKLKYQTRDYKKIPEHWLTFGARRSIINKSSNRNAVNPANAMLNYLYALLAGEARLKILQAGLEPSAGIFHSDHKYRHSFIYDVIEPVRPIIDAWLIDFINHNKLHKNYFVEKENGVVRLTLYLTPLLCETITLWGNLIEPVISNLKRILTK
jgi:CRISPR-associated endonuclease Cas1